MMTTNTMGLPLKRCMRSGGTTLYLKQGQWVMRPSHSEEKRSCTRDQFFQQQRMRHSVALWHMISGCHPFFTQRKTVYGNFIALANRLPAVYVPDDGTMNGASFLMPDIPVSDGSLTPIKQQLGSVDGTAALLTDLKADDIQRYERLLLYTAEQCIEERIPRVRFHLVREMAKDEFVEVDGRLALTGEEFANTMRGWALVRVRPSSTPGKDRCSTQSIVTQCRFYEQYTTEEALQYAAESYGGLTESL